MINKLKKLFSAVRYGNHDTYGRKRDLSVRIAQLARTIRDEPHLAIDTYVVAAYLERNTYVGGQLLGGITDLIIDDGINFNIRAFNADGSERQRWVRQARTYLESRMDDQVELSGMKLIDVEKAVCRNLVGKGECFILEANDAMVQFIDPRHIYSRKGFEQTNGITYDEFMKPVEFLYNPDLYQSTAKLADPILMTGLDYITCSPNAEGERAITNYAKMHDNITVLEDIIRAAGTSLSLSLKIALKMTRNEENAANFSELQDENPDNDPEFKNTNNKAISAYRNKQRMYDGTIVSLEEGESVDTIGGTSQVQYLAGHLKSQIEIISMMMGLPAEILFSMLSSANFSVSKSAALLARKYIRKKQRMIWCGFKKKLISRILAQGMTDGDLPNIPNFMLAHSDPGFEFHDAARELIPLLTAGAISRSELCRRINVDYDDMQSEIIDELVQAHLLAQNANDAQGVNVLPSDIIDNSLLVREEIQVDRTRSGQ